MLVGVTDEGMNYRPACIKSMHAFWGREPSCISQTRCLIRARETVCVGYKRGTMTFIRVATCPWGRTISLNHRIGLDFLSTDHSC